VQARCGQHPMDVFSLLAAFDVVREVRKQVDSVVDVMADKGRQELPV
jgi:hypothetical protein